MIIWPRKRLPDVLMHGAPPGSIGATSDSGWTDGALFIKWLLPKRKTKISSEIFYMFSHMTFAYYI